MDLFYANLTPTQQLKKFKEDAMHHFNIEDSTKFKVLKGLPKHFGNCVLFLLSHVPSRGFLKGRNDKLLTDSIKHFDITNHAITYAYLKPSLNVSRKDLKACTGDMNLILSIVRPKLIVLVGENPGELFFGRKPKVVDVHGTIVGSIDKIPLVSTFDMLYYKEKTGYEDERYKRHIYEGDWNFIREQYKGAINANV